MADAPHLLGIRMNDLDNASWLDILVRQFGIVTTHAIQTADTQETLMIAGRLTNCNLSQSSWIETCLSNKGFCDYHSTIR